MLVVTDDGWEVLHANAHGGHRWKLTNTHQTNCTALLIVSLPKYISPESKFSDGANSTSPRCMRERLFIICNQGGGLARPNAGGNTLTHSNMLTVAVFPNPCQEQHQTHQVKSWLRI